MVVTSYLSFDGNVKGLDYLIYMFTRAMGLYDSS